MATENTARLAVLIDADNAQASITELLLAEVAKYGTAHVKRAYGDWTAPNLRQGAGGLITVQLGSVRHLESSLPRIPARLPRRWSHPL